jgi:cysteine synthase A
MWLAMGRSSEGGREPQRRPALASSRLRHVGEGLADLVGNTPLIRIKSLSEQTGCEVGCWTSITPPQLDGRATGPREAALAQPIACPACRPQILAKAEFLNPGGSVKDRVALEIIQEALAEGRLAPGGLVIEGTVGSTGVSLAMCAAAAGCQAFIAMPDDAAIEKAQILQVGATAGQHTALGSSPAWPAAALPGTPPLHCLTPFQLLPQALGAQVQRLRPVSITHPDHFVNVAQRHAAQQPNAVFADQFHNLANFRAHLATGGWLHGCTRAAASGVVSAWGGWIHDNRSVGRQHGGGDLARHGFDGSHPIYLGFGDAWRARPVPMAAESQVVRFGSRRAGVWMRL